jgi:hypothetical protein
VRLKLETRAPHAEALKRDDMGMHVGFVRSSQKLEMSVIIDRVRITRKCLMLFIKDKLLKPNIKFVRTPHIAWHTRKRASLGSGTLASSLVGLGPQYVRAGTWSGPEATRLPRAGGQAVAQALCAFLSLGVCRDEYLKGTLSLCQPVASREQGLSREAAFKVSRMRGSDAWVEYHRKKWRGCHRKQT